MPTFNLLVTIRLFFMLSTLIATTWASTLVTATITDQVLVDIMLALLVNIFALLGLIITNKGLK